LLISNISDSDEFRFYKSHPNGDKDKVTFGASLVINCTTNDPTATTSLYFRHGNEKDFVLTDNISVKVKRNHDVFTILDFGFGSMGLYECRSTNKNGKTIKWADPNTKVFPEDPYYPKAEISTSKKDLDVGENFNLSCTTDSTKVVISWLKINQNNKHVPVFRHIISTPLQNGDKTSFLVIKNATIDDSGEYICIATADNTNATNKAIIKVFGEYNYKYLFVLLKISNFENIFLFYKHVVLLISDVYQDTETLCKGSSIHMRDLGPATNSCNRFAPGVYSLLFNQCDSMKHSKPPVA